jgi:hypothetical protein
MALVVEAEDGVATTEGAIASAGGGGGMTTGAAGRSGVVV